MSRKPWSDVELSAYLDGQLKPETRAALDADLSGDAALRDRVATLRQTVALVQALPLRETPRNYLLTPSMVAEQQPKPVLRHTPMRRIPTRLMQLATALSAVAFVIAVGFNLTVGQFLPGGGMAPAPLAEQAMDMAKEKTAAEEAPVMFMEAPVEAPAEKLGEPPAPAATDEPEEVAARNGEAERPVNETEEPAVADDVAPGDENPVWEEAGAPEAPPEDVGGGAEGGETVGDVLAGATEEAELGMATAPLIPETTEELEICAVGESGEECAPPIPEEEVADVSPPTHDEALAPEVVDSEKAPEASDAEATETASWGISWVVIVLGLSTLGLGITTWILSRRR